MDKPMDRRARRTRLALRHGLSKLMKEKPVNLISVRELSDLCDINRGTFYLHYHDVFDMVDQIEQELFSDIEKIIKKYGAVSGERLLSMLKELFSFFDENRDICSAILGKYGNTSFVRRVTVMAREIYLNMWRRASSEDVKHVERRFWFMVSGAMGIIQDWLSDSSPESPDEIAELTCQMVSGGMQIIS